MRSNTKTFQSTPSQLDALINTRARGGGEGAVLHPKGWLGEGQVLIRNKSTTWVSVSHMAQVP